MFQVLDNGKPADCHHHKVDSSWNKSIYDSFEEAEKYAQNWLGTFFGGVVLKVNTPIDYDGYGSTIEIKEIK